MRRLACLALALVLAGCAARGPEPEGHDKAQAAPLYSGESQVKPDYARPATRPERPRWLPPVLHLLLAEADPVPIDPDITMRAAELAPPVRRSAAAGAMVTPGKRYICIGRYDWLRSDLWSALSWCLHKFYWDISGSSDQDRRLVLQDASSL